MAWALIPYVALPLVAALQRLCVCYGYEGKPWPVAVREAKFALLGVGLIVCLFALVRVGIWHKL